VTEYGIDAVHVDATAYGGLLRRLREKLPDTVMCGEWFQTLTGMDFLVFQHNCAQTLSKYDAMQKWTAEQMAVPLQSLDEEFAWMDKASPVCRFAKEYVYTYPHLCAANAFVPVGKVCSTWPDRQMPCHKEELWDVLRDYKRLDYFPGLRVNYRDYGLDEDTRQAIQELTAR